MLPILLLERQMTLSELERKSGVPHATLFDICSGKTDFKKCNIETAIKIADALNMNVKSLYEKLTCLDLTDIIVNQDFDLFRSNTLHNFKKMRWEQFKDKYTKLVQPYFNEKEFDKCLYLVTLLDDVAKKHNEKVNKDFNNIRNLKLDKLLVPSSIYLQLSLNAINCMSFIKHASKPFLEKNIIEENKYYE